jgi:hypothetical protein
MKRRSILGFAGVGLASMAGCTTATTGSSNPEYDARGIVYSKDIYRTPRKRICGYDRPSDGFYISRGVDEELKRQLQRAMPSGPSAEISVETDEELQSLIPGFTYRLFLKINYPLDAPEGPEGGGDSAIDGYSFFISRELLNSVHLDQEVGVSLADQVENHGVSDDDIDLDPTLDTITETHDIEYDEVLSFF